MKIQTLADYETFLNEKFQTVYNELKNLFPEQKIEEAKEKFIANTHQERQKVAKYLEIIKKGKKVQHKNFITSNVRIYTGIETEGMELIITFKEGRSKNTYFEKIKYMN